MPNKSSAIGTYSDISKAAFFGMAVLTTADVIPLVAVLDHARLVIDSGIFLHQSEDDMIQLVIGLPELSLDLPESAFHTLQRPNIFR